MNDKPIIIIDDDNDDLDLIQEAFSQLDIENEIIYFSNGLEFLDFIRATKNNAFFILCDVNMAKITGLDLKKMIFEDEVLRLKCVPFIFISTSYMLADVVQAYSCDVQGYFIKPDTFEGIKNMLQFIVNYWSHSVQPKISIRDTTKNFGKA
jgi:CheY-like chemotaxis protein